MNDKEVDISKVLLSALAIGKEDLAELKPYLKEGHADRKAALDSLIVARKAITCDSFRGHTGGFDAHINLDSTSAMFRGKAI